MKYLQLSVCFLYAALVTAQTKESPEMYFKAKRFGDMEKKNTNRKEPAYFFYKAVFASVCNKPALSNQYLDSLESKQVPDVHLFEYWTLRNDNYVKLCDYKKAYQTNQLLNTRFKKRFNKEEYDGSVQTEKIWKELLEVKPQQVVFKSKVSLPLTHDLAGLINIRVNANHIDTNFVFDTGAGISSITESFATLMGMKIFDSRDIVVEGFTGVGNKVRLATIDSLSLGTAVVYNPVFLVFNDSALTFAGGAYKINGIIGFPIAKDMGTITIMKDQLEFERIEAAAPKNLFIELLLPMVMLKLNGTEDPYGFDTGAKQSTLSKAFYERYKNDEQMKGAKATTSEAASAGGTLKYKAMQVPILYFQLSGQVVKIPNAEIDLDHYHPGGKQFYGNIGQDLLQQYSKVIISFENNYLKLEN
jgi:hypothetical protein